MDTVLSKALQEIVSLEKRMARYAAKPRAHIEPEPKRYPKAPEPKAYRSPIESAWSLVER